MDTIKIIQFVARQMFCLQVWASVKFITYNNTDKLLGICIKILYNVPHLHVESHNVVLVTYVIYSRNIIKLAIKTLNWNVENAQFWDFI